MPPRKRKKCPYLTSTKEGKWTKLVCSIPAGKECPNPRCLANPDPVEEDPFGEDEV